MAKQYHHYCPMSYSLDVIGDRWTLHIVRDLMLSPLRYSDLKKGLPGIASNLLVTRLKDLEVAGVIEKQQLPFPANSEVYALTERGKQLDTVIGALSMWGIPYLDDIPPGEDFVSYVPFQGYLKAFFSAEKAQGIEMICQIHSDSFSFFVVIMDNAIETYPGKSPHTDITMRVNDLRSLVAVVNDAISVEEVLATKAVLLEDEAMRPAFEQFVGLFEKA